MSSPEVIYACRWLIRDTFRQALANRVFWVMLGACAVVILFCLSISIEGGESLESPDRRDIRIETGVDRPNGHMLLAFGAWRLELGRGRPGNGAFHSPRPGGRRVRRRRDAVGPGSDRRVRARISPGQAMPRFCCPSRRPRWVLLLGKYLGVLTLLACLCRRVRRRHLAGRSACAPASGSTAISGACRCCCCRLRPSTAFRRFLGVCTRQQPRRACSAPCCSGSCAGA